MKGSKFILTFLSALLSWSSGVAQSENKDKVFSELYGLQKIYADQQGLSFDIRYHYYNEGKPGIVLDSLKGEMFLSGNDYRYRIDKTETIRNAKYTIILFEEDSLMHISGSKKASDFLVNPAVLIDSSFLNAPGAGYSIQISNNIKEVVINFPPEMPYKSVKYFIDNATGLLERMIMVVRTAHMTAATTNEELNMDGYDQYAVVETIFSNYKTVGKDVIKVNESAFFTKEDKQFVPTDKYRNYKIFIGTPNL